MNLNFPADSVTQLAIEAGNAILHIYQRDFDIEQKADASPLTEADLAAHLIITQGLAELTPEVPVLSEESAAVPWSVRRQWTRYWLVDPLDGTKEFIKKNGEFTVNIALIENGEPIWGVVHAPALGWTYQGGSASGASTLSKAGKKQALQVATLPRGRAGWRLVGSRSHQSEAFQKYVAQFDNPEIKSLGSSLKICMVAEGEADLYPRLGPTSEWDTAAAHAVLRGAGGDIVEANSLEPLRYNQKDSLLNPHFLAAPVGFSLAEAFK